MEDPADAIVPLRPGFDIQIRGFNRNQVIEHIELLEDQLKIVTIDRNEAIQLNADLRQLCEDTRHDLNESEQRLRRIESSETGLPAASQRVQNMLAMAEEEVQTLREQANRQAEIVRGSAEQEARALISEAESAATALRQECGELVADVESRRIRLRREHTKSIRELRRREKRLRRTIRDEYTKMIETGQDESDQLLARTQRYCAERDAETERFRLEALEEINRKRLELDELRQLALASLETVMESISASASALQVQPSTAPDEANPNAEDDDRPRFPDRDPDIQEDDQPTYPVQLDQPGNGTGPATEPTDFADVHDSSARRN
jgi:cell division septum initiation protein DivIVA